MTSPTEEERFRRIFRRGHADHAACARDEWLMQPCRSTDGALADRSLVWSRRNGPWRQVDVLWVGAAPGNAGGMGGGDMGAHGTRIPFGGDIAGANLDLLLDAIGLDRNDTYIVASLNQLPDRGGGEPSVAELRRPVGAYPSSLHLLRDSILAAGPRLLIALGNVALRSSIAAGGLPGGLRGETARLTLPGLKRLEAAGLARGKATPWPDAFAPADAFRSVWREAWDGRPVPRILWLLHPSAQNMSPFAGVDTVFHRRMLDTRRALREAVLAVCPQIDPTLDARRTGGIYALPEWVRSIGPRHAELVALWKEKGL